MSVVLFATVIVNISLEGYEKRKLWKTTTIAANLAAANKMATKNAGFKMSIFYFFFFLISYQPFNYLPG